MLRKILRHLVVSWCLLFYVDLHSPQRWWRCISHSSVKLGCDHSCRGPKWARIGPAEPSLQSVQFPQEWLSSVCRIYDPSRPCYLTPSSSDGMARPHRWLFTAPPRSKRKCTIYLIAYPGGLPALWAIICRLSGSLVHSLETNFHLCLCGRTSG